MTVKSPLMINYAQVKEELEQVITEATCGDHWGELTEAQVRRIASICRTAHSVQGRLHCGIVHPLGAVCCELCDDYIMDDPVRWFDVEESNA